MPGVQVFVGNTCQFILHQGNRCDIELIVVCSHYQHSRKAAILIELAVILDERVGDNEVITRHRYRREICRLLRDLR
jgi:hypothetical protein